MTEAFDAAAAIVTGKADHSTVVGLGGAKEAGKDAFADILVRKYGFQKLGMSDGLHWSLMILNPWIQIGTQPEGFGKGVMNERGYPIWEPGSYVRYADICEIVGYTEAKKQYEVRRSLQLLGDDVTRVLDKDIWANYAKGKITEALEQGPVVLTGVRQLNEIAMVESLGGLTAYVKRKALTVEEDVAEQKRADRAHSSENGVTEYDFMARILNYGDLAALEQIADQFYVSWLAQQWQRSKNDSRSVNAAGAIPMTTVTPVRP